MTTDPHESMVQNMFNGHIDSEVTCPRGLEPLIRAGLRFGNRGTHTSRTIMLAELAELLAVVPEEANEDTYIQAIVKENVLGKRTAANRRLSRQRLRELYGLSPHLPLFRALRHLWRRDAQGRPLLALLCALARDPLLRLTAPVVMELRPGQELVRGDLYQVISDGVGGRLNDRVIDAVARNAASSWCQSGHLQGRMRKLRQRVSPTPAPLALAVWLGTQQGERGAALLESPWSRVLDRTAAELLPLALNAHRQGLIRARASGELVEIDPLPMDQALAGPPP